ncbi:MAG: hypothetical protein GY694_20555 [Gammaproteobacteria bacterium]|nr:hypothetical protein [Gammaproteobacteria bacterium]
MGQAIEYNPEDWDFNEEDELYVIQPEISLPSDFYKGQLNQDPLEAFSQDAEINEGEIVAYINGEKVDLKSDTGNLPVNQQELAFRRQIEDLFELLELEKESSKENGVRVYQTDSSPSRPWRFH